MAERLAYDIARDLRAPGPWPSPKLLCEAADKLEVTIDLLAKAERERDVARNKRTAEIVTALRTEAARLDARCARVGVASAISPGLNNVADMIEKGDL